MTLVKVCGIRTLEEGKHALTCGANWLGFVFWTGTRRYVDSRDATNVIQALRAEHWDFQAVGVFVDPEPADVARIVDLCRLDYVQLSGNESADLVRALPQPTVKALHVARGQEHQAAEIVETNALGATVYLLDTHTDGMYGGTGATFDWPVLRSIGPRCFVAGGLHSDNVADAIDALAPLGVDVSSGVEFPGAGKDPSRVHAFLEAVKQHDHHLTTVR